MANSSKLRYWLSVIGINAGLLLGFAVAFELAFGNWFVSYVVPEPRTPGSNHPIPSGALREGLVVLPQPLTKLRYRRPRQQQSAALILECIFDIAHR